MSFMTNLPFFLMMFSIGGCLVGALIGDLFTVLLWGTCALSQLGLFVWSIYLEYKILTKSDGGKINE